MRLTKDRPLVDALRFLTERHRTLLGVSVFLFAMDALTVWVANTTLVIIAVFAVIRALGRGFLRPGLLRSLDGARQGDALSVDELMSGFDCFEHAIGVQVLTDLVTLASFAVGALPGFAIMRFAPGLFLPGVVLAMAGGFGLYLYAYAGVRFAEHVVALERLGALTAMSRAWRLASGNRLRILHAIFVASTLEVVALIWGIGAFGFGMLLSIPYARIAGDHALVVLFAKLEKDEVATPAPAAPRWTLASARGASLIEYALIIVAIMLFAAGMFRTLGGSAGKNAGAASAVLDSRGSDGSGLASLGVTSAAATAMGPVSGFLSDFASGLVKGDFSDAKGFGKTAGQIVGGFIPVVGQISAVRDMAAAARDISEGKKGGWANLGMASIGLIPGGKAASAGIKGAAEAATAVKAIEEAGAVAKTVHATEDAAKAAAALKAETEAAEAAAAAAKRAAEQAAKDAALKDAANAKWPAKWPKTDGKVISEQRRAGIDEITGSVQGEVKSAIVDKKKAEIQAILDGAEGAPKELPQVKVVPDPNVPGGYVAIDQNHTLQAYRELGFKEIPTQTYNPSGVEWLKNQHSYNPEQYFPIGSMEKVPSFTGTPMEQLTRRAGKP